MANKKAEVKDKDEVELDSDLLDKFTNELESGINKVCAAHPDTDPRLELLVTLGLFAAQVAQDLSHGKEEFLSVMADMFDDVENAVSNDDEEDEEEAQLPITVITRKGNQFNIN